MTENPQLTTALKAYTSLTREQRNVLAKTVEGFVACLSPAPGDAHQNPHAEAVIQEQAWESRASWSRDEWMTWETWGWYRHFCRAVGACVFNLYHCGSCLSYSIRRTFAVI